MFLLRVVSCVYFWWSVNWKDRHSSCGNSCNSKHPQDLENSILSYWEWTIALMATFFDFNLTKNILENFTISLNLSVWLLAMLRWMKTGGWNADSRSRWFDCSEIKKKRNCLLSRYKKSNLMYIWGESQCVANEYESATFPLQYFPTCNDLLFLSMFLCQRLLQL